MVRERYQRVVRRKTGGHHPAPESAIQAVGLSADRMPLTEGLEREAGMLADLIAGDVHPHLLRLLRCRQAMRRPRGRNAEDGTPVDLTADLTLPDELRASLRNRMRSTAPDDLPSPSRTVPSIQVPGGYGLLRRLPLAVPPVTIEVAWVESDSPDLFQDLARRFVVEAGGSPVYCRNPEPSPGLSLITTYLLEGERLAAEGWSTEQIDEILEEWGMVKGPHALSLSLGEARGDAWKSPDETGNSSESVHGALTESGMTVNTGKEAEERLIEEVVSALLLTVSRNWESVDDPVEESWSILDVFVLGGPSFRGGVIGAARNMGPEKIRERLLAMQQRYGDYYAPHVLNRSGPFPSVPGD